MAPVMFEVVRISTFGAALIWSSCVRSALTTLMASLGSEPEAFLAAVRDSTSSMRTQTRDLRVRVRGCISADRNERLTSDSPGAAGSP